MSLQGAAFDVLDAVGSKANFTVYRQLSKSNSTHLMLKEHNNLVLMPQKLCDIIYFNDTSYHTTTSFNHLKCTMLITKGERYGSYDKLLMSFDITTWSLLLLTFTIVFGVIFAVNQTSKKIQKILYGESIHFPAFNVLGTFFGISQPQLPTSNFPRMILMCFILFCLVIRTAYQGVFFELMAADLRKYVPTTIDELLNTNFTFYGFNKEECFSVFKDVAKERVFIYKHLDEDKFCCIGMKEILEKDAAFIISEMNLKLIITVCNDHYLSLNEPFITLPIAMTMKRNHFMFHTVNEIVEQLIPAGIPQYFEKIASWDYNLKKEERFNNYEELESLKLDEWAFGFELWLTCLGISTVVFIFEMLHWPKIKNTWIKKYKIKDERKKRKRSKNNQVKPNLDEQILKEILKTLDFDVWEIKN